MSYLARRASRDTTFSPLTLDLRTASTSGESTHKRISDARSSRGGSARATEAGHQSPPISVPGVSALPATASPEPSPYLVTLLGSKAGAAVAAAAHHVYQDYMVSSSQRMDVHSTQGDGASAAQLLPAQQQQQHVGRLPGTSPGELTLGHGVTGASFSPPIQVSLPPPLHELRVDSQGNVAIVPAAAAGTPSREWAHAHSEWPVPEHEAAATPLQGPHQGQSVEVQDAATHDWSPMPESAGSPAHYVYQSQRKRTTGWCMVQCIIA
jgi:hypothetical protein